MSTINAQFKYVDEEKIDGDFKCAVCFEPLYIPVSSIKCGHTYCKACIINLSKCPICRADITSNDIIDSAIIIKKYVNSLKVYCPRCNNTYERSSLNDHLMMLVLKYVPLDVE